MKTTILKISLSLGDEIVYKQTLNTQRFLEGFKSCVGSLEVHTSTYLITRI